jgi:hypothetical protein
MDKINLSEEEIRELLGKQNHLAMQSFETLNGEITPLTFEIMSRQATINVGKLILKFENFQSRKKLYKNYQFKYK